MYASCIRLIAKVRKVADEQTFEIIQGDLCKTGRIVSLLPVRHSMPKRTDFPKSLIIGSGPIVIGRCDFDYSERGCNALRQTVYEIGWLTRTRHDHSRS